MKIKSIFRNNSEEVNLLKKHLKEKEKIFRKFKKMPVGKNWEELKQKIDSKEYSGIVVYSEAVMWQPLQRPQHFLRELAKKNYLCFFCEHNLKEKYLYKEVYKDVYLINHEENLIPLIKKSKVIFLITYFLQYEFSKQIKNKVIWLDILDRLDFFANYNEYSRKLWKRLIKRADFITYSAEKLKEYIPKHLPALEIKNAVNPEDFLIDKDLITPIEIEEIIKKGKPILGYYGAIEEWFDFELVKKLDFTNKFSIILIGNINENLNIKNYEFKNVYFLGFKPYNELKNYAKYFNVALIPFKVNDLTNNVSPVKFFEYMALNLPVASTPIYEMKNYKTKVLKFINKNNIIKVVEELLKINKKITEEECYKIAKDNTWNIRISKVINCIEKEY